MLMWNVKKVTQDGRSLINANSLRQHETVNGIHQVGRGIMRFLQSEFTSRKDQVKLTFSNFKVRNSKTSNSWFIVSFERSIFPAGIQHCSPSVLNSHSWPLQLLLTFLNCWVIKRGCMLGCMGSPGDPAVDIRQKTHLPIAVAALRMFPLTSH